MGAYEKNDRVYYLKRREISRVPPPRYRIDLPDAFWKVDRGFSAIPLVLSSSSFNANEIMIKGYYTGISIRLPFVTRANLGEGS